MYIDMKFLRHYIAFITVIALAMLAGCTTTPKSKPVTDRIHEQLSTEEQKAYDEAIAYIKSGDDEKATPVLVRIANNHPSHLGTFINLANIYIRESKIADAASALQKVKAINSDIPEAYNLQGLIEMSSGKYADAEKSYQNAINLKDDYPTAHYNLALLYDIYYQDLEHAVAQYNRYNELTGGADKKTVSWNEELKQKLKRKGK